MKKWWKNYIVFAGLTCLLGIYMAGNQKELLWEKGKLYFYQKTQEIAEETYFPSILYSQKEKVDSNLHEKLASQVMKMVPLGDYVVGQRKEEMVPEDEETYELLLKRQAEDESSVDAEGNLVGTDSSQETIQEVVENENLSMDKLQNQDFLVSNFYTVDSVTYLEEGDLNAQNMLGMDMHLSEEDNGPKILIFHTHSQEAFVDSDGTVETSIVGIGRYLTQLLNETYQIETIHHEGVYDLINGKLDRSEAYERARPEIAQILKENPSVEVVIDLHRDGVKETTHLVTEQNGKQMAQIMFFNGMCRTRSNGDLASMLNPYIEENLAFSMQMKIAAERWFPGFTRRNYLKGYKYNMDLMPKMLLIEAGAQTNTIEEMRNAMEPLAYLLNKVLKE